MISGGGFAGDSVVDQLADLGQLVEAVAEVAEVVGAGAVGVGSALSIVPTVPPRQRRLQIRHDRERRVQRAQVASVGPSAGDPSDEAFEVVGGRERVGDSLTDEGAIGQLADRVVAAPDRVGVDERATEPPF